MKEDKELYTSAQVRTKCGAKFWRKRARGEICKFGPKWPDTERASDSACSCVIFTRKWAAVWSLLIFEKVRRHLPHGWGHFARAVTLDPLVELQSCLTLDREILVGHDSPREKPTENPFFFHFGKIGLLAGPFLCPKSLFWVGGGGWGMGVRG